MNDIHNAMIIIGLVENLYYRRYKVDWCFFKIETIFFPFIVLDFFAISILYHRLIFYNCRLLSYFIFLIVS